ncbi:MAG: hypothetical protein ACHQ9S_22780 [Candidatus Binatia bacterium]
MKRGIVTIVARQITGGLVFAALGLTLAHLQAHADTIDVSAGVTTPSSVRPEITFFGLVRPDTAVLSPDSTDVVGNPVYTRNFGVGFYVVVEARPGLSGALPGTWTFNYSPTDPSVRPDLQIVPDRDLGNGSSLVCDSAPSGPGPTPAVAAGGVPGVNLSSVDSQKLAEVMNDFGCRFEARTSSQDACTSPDLSGTYSFVNSTSTIQYCTSWTIGQELQFHSGDTVLTVQVRDTTGNLSDPESILVRVPPRSPTRTPANTATPRRTATPEATSTPTSAPAQAWIAFGSGSGAPNDQVPIAVTLHAPTEQIAGLQVDIDFDPSTPIAATADGHPQCTVNPSINKNATSFAFQPHGCTPGLNCDRVIAFVLDFGNLDPIADGATLFTCTVQIAGAATAGDHPLVCFGAQGSDPTSHALPLTCTGGSIAVNKACVGDCNGDHQVTVDELLTGVGVALGNVPMDQCPAFDANGDGTVTIDELLAGVIDALNGCP